MLGSRLGSVVHYTMAVVAVAVATGVRLLLGPVLGDRAPFAVLFLAILVVAGFGGFGPALAATMLGAMAAVVVLLPEVNPVDTALAQQASLAGC